jgi:hypothetical protein
MKLIVDEAGIYPAPICVDIYRPDAVSQRKDILATIAKLQKSIRILYQHYKRILCAYNGQKINAEQDGGQIKHKGIYLTGRKELRLEQCSNG